MPSGLRLVVVNRADRMFASRDQLSACLSSLSHRRHTNLCKKRANSNCFLPLSSKICDKAWRDLRSGHGHGAGGWGEGEDHKSAPNPEPRTPRPDLGPRPPTPSDNSVIPASSVIPAKAGIQNTRQCYLYIPASKRNGTLYVGVTVLVYYGT